MKIGCAILLIAISLSSFQSHAEPTDTEESEVRKALADFIQAFDNLEWDRFRGAFADDATVFYPREFPRRANGRAEFEKLFHKVFDHIHAGNTEAPYMNIQPKDLTIQVAGAVAIVTFHLDDRPGFLNRRTVVLEKQAARWKIIHLHASEVAIASQLHSTARFA